MTRLSCHRFRGNEVRLWLSILAYNLGANLNGLSRTEVRFETRPQSGSRIRLHPATGPDMRLGDRWVPFRHHRRVQRFRSAWRPRSESSKCDGLRRLPPASCALVP